MHIAKKLKTFLYFFFAALLLSILAICLLPIAKEASVIPHQGSLQIKVVDGFSDLPLLGATVVVPEADAQHITDENGQTPAIIVPIENDPRFNTLLSQPWGQATIMVYKEGYIPYALFYTAVWENQMRQGPTIYLFPEGATEGNEPFIVVEGPQRLWVQELLEKYQP